MKKINARNQIDYFVQYIYLFLQLSITLIANPCNIHITCVYQDKRTFIANQAPIIPVNGIFFVALGDMNIVEFPPFACAISIHKANVMTTRCCISAMCDYGMQCEIGWHI